MPNKLNKTFILPIGSQVELYPLNCPNPNPLKVRTIENMYIEERMLYGWGTAREKKHYCLYNVKEQRVVMHGILSEGTNALVVVLKRKDLL